MKYEAKVKYERIDSQSGKNKVVSETYLLDAETFGDAEERTLKYMSEITNSTVVATIKKSDIEDIVGDKESGTFYKATVKQSVIDELSGKESTQSIKLLAGREYFSASLSAVSEWMLGSMSDCEVTQITKSPIVGIF